jgi:hypothetical protein
MVARHSNWRIGGVVDMRERPRPTGARLRASAGPHDDRKCSSVRSAHTTTYLHITQAQAALKQAIEHGNMGHPDVADRAADEAVNHLQMAYQGRSPG